MDTDSDEGDDYRVEAVFLNGVRIWMDTNHPMVEMGSETSIPFHQVDIVVGEHPTAAGHYAWIYC